MKLEDKLEVVLDYANLYSLGDPFVIGKDAYVIVKHEVLRAPVRSYYTIYKPNRFFPAISTALVKTRIKLGI